MRSFLAVGVLAGVACIMHGCVGDDPIISSGTGPGIGEEGGACTSGGACNAPLQCRSKICVSDGTDAAVPDAKPLETGIDADSPDAKSDALGDAPADTGPQSCGHPGEPLCVFVTDTTYAGGFLRFKPAGTADAMCKDAAVAGRLGGSNYYAVIATTSDTGTLVLSLKNTVSASGWALTDGTAVVRAGASFLQQQPLLASIHLSELKRDVAAAEGSNGCVWTGAAASGETSSDNCSDFTSSGTIVSTPNGRVGSMGARSSEWLSSGSLACDKNCHIYCIQKPN